MRPHRPCTRVAPPLVAPMGRLLHLTVERRATFGVAKLCFDCVCSFAIPFKSQILYYTALCRSARAPGWTRGSIAVPLSSRFEAPPNLLYIAMIGRDFPLHKLIFSSILTSAPLQLRLQLIFFRFFWPSHDVNMEPWMATFSHHGVKKAR